MTMERTHTVKNENGLVEVIHNQNGAVLTTSISNARVKTEEGKEMTVYFVVFHRSREANNMSNDDWNAMKLTAIRGFGKEVYNRFLFQSSDKNPEKLYKSVFGVKGKGMTLVPKFDILQVQS